MSKSDTQEILTLLNDGEHGSWYVTELYHALIEYIKSGQAISEMGHDDFFLGACGNMDETNYSRHKPSTCTVFQLARACSRYLSDFDMNYTWYRNLSTWQDFCKFVVERARINYLKRNLRKLIKSHNYYVRKIECPACGSRRHDDLLDRKDEVYVETKGRLVYVNCQRCGKYNMTFSAFKFLNTFENKAKLFVFLFTRANKHLECESTITPKLLKETLKLDSR